MEKNKQISYKPVTGHLPVGLRGLDRFSEYVLHIVCPYHGFLWRLFQQAYSLAETDAPGYIPDLF